MSDLGRAVERILTGGRGPAPTFGEVLTAFIASAGSGRAAARQLGIAESTVRRWRSGAGKPSPAYLDRFGQASRDLRARHVTNEDLSIRTTDQGGGHPGQRVRRERVIKASQLRMGTGAAERVREAYVRGGAEAAAKVFLSEVKEPFYRSYLAAANKGVSSGNGPGRGSGGGGGVVGGAGSGGGTGGGEGRARGEGSGGGGSDGRSGGDRGYGLDGEAPDGYEGDQVADDYGAAILS